MAVFSTAVTHTDHRECNIFHIYLCVSCMWACVKGVCVWDKEIEERGDNIEEKKELWQD